MQRVQGIEPKKGGLTRSVRPFYADCVKKCVRAFFLGTDKEGG